MKNKIFRSQHIRIEFRPIPPLTNDEIDYRDAIQSLQREWESIKEDVERELFKRVQLPRQLDE